MKRRLLFLAAAIIGTSACASTPNAPMHVYNSSFLENDGVVDATPRERGFDPLRLGDYASDASVYVVRNDGRWTGGPAASEPALDVNGGGGTAVAQTTPDPAPTRNSEPSATKKRPSLSTNAPTQAGVGAKRDVDSSAMADVKKEAVDTGGYEPATAAQFVSSVYGMNGINLPNASPAAIYKTCKAQEKVYFGTRPKVGDVVFFHNTFDANGDGRNNDWYTHVGMVQAISGEATAEVVAWKDGKTTVHKVNLERPEVSEAAGETLNSRLRVPGNDDAPFTQYYSGQLFAGFCGVLGEKDEFVLVENWQPGMVLQK